MAGILPFSRTIKNKKELIYFLFSRETMDDKKSKDRGLWSEFGGSRDKGETHLETAIREGYEESNGVFGPKKKLKENILKTNITLKNKTYNSFLIEVPYNSQLPNYLENIYKFIKNKKPELICNKEGLFEKDKFKWIEINELENNMEMFRPFYREIVLQIIKNENKFKKNKK
tara:strand:- start:49 stop:564 length:516 start_codon:yes stop_codon:yes gene_type:complete